MTTDPTIIANKCTTYFADIGLRLLESVNNTHNAHFTDYLLNSSMYNFTFEIITEETTMEILNNLILNQNQAVGIMEFPLNY